MARCFKNFGWIQNHHATAVLFCFSVISSYNTTNSVSTFRLNIIHVDIATNGVCCVITISFITNVTTANGTDPSTLQLASSWIRCCCESSLTLSIWVTNNNGITYVGILFDHQLKFHLHTTDVAAKANRLLGVIRRSFDYLDPDMLVKLFVTVVRPTLEYCNLVWEPLFVLDQRKIKRFKW